MGDPKQASEHLKAADQVEAALQALASETEFGFLFLGGTYETQGGERVKMVEIANIGTTYETLVDEAGAHRYSRRVHDMGRCTGTAHDYSDPRNIKRPIRALALDDPHRKSPPSASRQFTTTQSEARNEQR